MNPAFQPFAHRYSAPALLIACLLGVAPVTRAAISSEENAVRLLQTELPAKVTLLNADCEQLTAAVGKATLVHQPDAPAILRMALTRGVKKLRHAEEKLPCACAKRIFSVSLAAAPPQASALLDLVTEMYPDSATELAGALRDYDQVAFDYKDRVNDKNVVDDKNGPARNGSGLSDPSAPQHPGNDPTSASQDPGDLSDRDIAGLGFADFTGFGTGFGPGFPGSPGFYGSPPSGGLALPPSPVTAAVNS